MTKRTITNTTDWDLAVEVARTEYASEHDYAGNVLTIDASCEACLPMCSDGSRTYRVPLVSPIGNITVAEVQVRILDGRMVSHGLALLA